ncbi:uncharacterized protein [Branchiostoma lanceolatum]|uniref:uncharacterized protein n=1 Tax=Branchiostoma lanceolatum TaxID=7740 RepID=UPI0034554DE5
MPTTIEQCAPHVCEPEEDLPWFCYTEPFIIETYYEGGPNGTCCEKHRCFRREGTPEEECQPYNYTDYIHYDEEGMDCVSNEEVLHTYCEGRCTSQANLLPSAPHCPADWHTDDDISCYKVIDDEERDQQGATDRCAELGGRLASFSTQDKEAYLLQLLANYTGTVDLWVGLAIDPETGQWTWTDGMEAGIDTNWKSISNTERCATATPDGQFISKACEWSLPYICERAPGTMVRDLCRCCTASEFEEEHVAMTCGTQQSFYYTHRIITDCVCEEHYCEYEDEHYVPVG